MQAYEAGRSGGPGFAASQWAKRGNRGPYFDREIQFFDRNAAGERWVWPFLEHGPLRSSRWCGPRPRELPAAEIVEYLGEDGLIGAT
jgi:hypothetical protein